MFFKRCRKYAVWHIYWGDELICRVFTKSEAEKLVTILGIGYRYEKEKYCDD